MASGFAPEGKHREGAVVGFWRYWPNIAWKRPGTRELLPVPCTSLVGRHAERLVDAAACPC